MKCQNFASQLHKVMHVCMLWLTFCTVLDTTDIDKNILNALWICKRGIVHIKMCVHAPASLV